MSETSATRAVRKEEVERNTMGYTIEIPYVQVQEEPTERGVVTITLPNKTKINVTEIHRTANKELFIMPRGSGPKNVNFLNGPKMVSE